MGTRADYYVGRDPKTMVWLGSTAWDGYPDGKPAFYRLAKAETAEEYLVAIKKLAKGEDDWTDPKQGWPWPWGDSRTTDYAYAWDAGRLWCSRFGHKWFDVAENARRLAEFDAREKELEEQDEDAVAAFYAELDRYEEQRDGDKESQFPSMEDAQNVTLGKRSGILFF